MNEWEIELLESFDRKYHGFGFWEAEFGGRGRKDPRRGNNHNSRLSHQSWLRKQRAIRRRNKANGHI